jgi:hypothetical protein
MTTNIDHFKNDLDNLIKTGDHLLNSIQLECFPEKFTHEVKNQLGEEAEEFLKTIPNFTDKYQSWFSEAIVLLQQILPARLPDFVRLYEKPKSRKNVSFENYRIEDCLQGLRVTQGYTKEKVVGPEAAIPHFRQQLAIVKSMRKRFESSLFDIRQLVQADLFDSELDAAKELLRKKFTRAAGALAGVVLERHLNQVCVSHNITVSKKDPGIGDFNDLLKESGVFDIPQWRFIQHLADIRNLCDHSKTVEPAIEQVDDLITGVMKVIKTVF